MSELDDMEVALARALPGRTKRQIRAMAKLRIAEDGEQLRQAHADALARSGMTGKRSELLALVDVEIAVEKGRQP